MDLHVAGRPRCVRFHGCEVQRSDRPGEVRRAGVDAPDDGTRRTITTFGPLESFGRSNRSAKERPEPPNDPNVFYVLPRPAPADVSRKFRPRNHTSVD